MVLGGGEGGLGGGGVGGGEWCVGFVRGVLVVGEWGVCVSCWVLAAGDVGVGCVSVCIGVGFGGVWVRGARTGTYQN